jgi:hypothetical protein
VNRFWNLYPVCSRCNSRKRDRIPALSKALIEKIQHHLKRCIGNLQIPIGKLISQDLEHLYRHQFSSEKVTEDEGRKIEEITEFILSIRNDLASKIPGEFFHTRKKAKADKIKVSPKLVGIDE